MVLKTHIQTFGCNYHKEKQQEAKSIMKKDINKPNKS
jgi:hypothetical protein